MPLLSCATDIRDTIDRSTGTRNITSRPGSDVARVARSEYEIREPTGSGAMS